MLSEDVLERLSERLVNRIESLNTFFINKLGEQIVDIGELTPSQLQQLMQSIKYGNSLDEIANKLAEITDKNVEDIYEIFEEVAKKNQSFAKQFYEYRNIDYIPFDKNEALKKQVKAIADVTVNEYLNMSKTIAYTTYNDLGIKQFTSLSETYQKVTDEAILSISQGRESFDTVMKRTMKQLASNGLRTVDYASGYSRRLDSSVRMNIMDGVRRLNRELQEEFGNEFGADGIEVSHHKNPAPDHEDTVDGKQFSKEEYERINNSLDRHVGELNCYHFIYPIILGISKPLYSKEQLEADKKSNKNGFEFEGTKYTNYQGTQLQRKIESKIRQYKDRQIGAKAINDTDEVYHCQEKIEQLTHKYNELSKASGLPTKVDRLRVEGYTKITKSKNNKFLSESLDDIDVPDFMKNRNRTLKQETLDMLPRHMRKECENTKISFHNEKYSYYNAKDDKIVLRADSDKYNLIHEYGHKIETSKNLYSDKEFVTIISDKFSKYKVSDFKEVRGKTGKYFVLKDSNEFVSQYQTRIYSGGFNFRKKIKIKYAREYFPEGLKLYFKDRELLKRKDIKLYNYINKMMEDK